MKHNYQAPEIELMYLSRDVITTSAADPYEKDIKWDLSTSSADPASLLDING